MDFIRKNTEVDGIRGWFWIKEDIYGFSHPAGEWPLLRDYFLKYVRSRGTIVQAGGLMGMYPKLWGKYFQTVYTFEPNPTNFYCLARNCPEDHIIKMQAALGAVSGTVRSTNVRPRNMGLAKVEPHGIIPCLRLDDLRLGPIDAIQLDCEGSEPEIIEGALETIARYRPVVSCESVSGKMHSSFEMLGYRKVIKHGMETIFVYEY